LLARLSTTIVSAFETRTLFWSGTGISTGLTAVVPPTAATEFTVKVVAAVAGVTPTIVPIAKAAAIATEIFLNEFIILLVYFYISLN
jgi:hypothetical protein